MAKQRWEYFVGLKTQIKSVLGVSGTVLQAGDLRKKIRQLTPSWGLFQGDSLRLTILLDVDQVFGSPWSSRHFSKAFRTQIPRNLSHSPASLRFQMTGSGSRRAPWES